MENLVKHLEFMSRRFNSVMPVGTIGFVPRKKERIIRVFDTFNFSFILEGTGTYLYRGKVYEVNAPCVLTQFPGEPMDYGPDKSWYEVYLIYPGSVMEAVKKRDFFKPEKPLWDISNPEGVLSSIERLKTALREKKTVPDRVDYICEGMIMESLLAKAVPPANEEEKKIRMIKSFVSNNFTDKHDFTEISRQNGMSLSSFRRHWLKYIGTTPARYQSQLLIQEACRLLVEQHMSIKEIAGVLNFDDPFYFTKKFHHETGVTPTQYRKQHKLFY